jgi:hypothetical protein
MHVNQPSEDTATEMIRCMDACIKKRPDDASIYDMFGNWLMIHGFTQDAVNTWKPQSSWIQRDALVHTTRLPTFASLPWTFKMRTGLAY